MPMKNKQEIIFKGYNYIDNSYFVLIFDLFFPFLYPKCFYLHFINEKKMRFIDIKCLTYCKPCTTCSERLSYFPMATQLATGCAFTEFESVV